MATPERVPQAPPPAQYRVLRSFTGSQGVYAPGTVITIDASWPYHRASDLTRLRYLEPIAPTRGRAN